MTDKTIKSRYTKQHLDQMIEDRKVERVAGIEADREIAELDYDDIEPTIGKQIPKDRPPMEYFVDHYAPRCLFLLSGQEGLGKGLCAVWMAAQVIRQNKDGNVLFLSTEDDAPEIRRRFRAAGIKDPVFDKRVFHGEYRLSEKFLGEVVEKHNIVFIVMDALRDFTLRTSGIRGGASNDDTGVRASVIRIRQFAQKYGITVVGIHHTNKMRLGSDGRRAGVRERIGGAAAWQQVPRHTVMVDERNDGVRAISIPKSNIHPEGFTMTYMLEDVALPGGDNGKRFVPSGLIDEELSMNQWLSEVDGQAPLEQLSAEEEYDLVLEALKDTKRDDGTLLGAGPLWHEAFKDQGTVRKTSIAPILARIRADGIITGHTVKIEFTDEVLAREALELELEQEAKRLGLKTKGRK